MGMNNIPIKPNSCYKKGNNISDYTCEQLQKPWDLASCSRKDMQCFFMPMSPCVITEEALREAPILGDKNLEIFRTTGKLPKRFLDEKIIIIPLIIDRLVSKPKIFQESIINI